MTPPVPLSAPSLRPLPVFRIPYSECQSQTAGVRAESCHGRACLTDHEANNNAWAPRCPVVSCTHVAARRRRSCRIDCWKRDESGSSRSWTHKCSRCGHLQYLHATSYCVLTGLGRRDVLAAVGHRVAGLGGDIIRAVQYLSPATFRLLHSPTPRSRLLYFRCWLLDDDSNDARPVRIPASAPGRGWRGGRRLRRTLLTDAANTRITQGRSPGAH